jgi:hypothetical protein
MRLSQFVVTMNEMSVLVVVITDGGLVVEKVAGEIPHRKPFSLFLTNHWMETHRSELTAGRSPAYTRI